MTIPGVDLVCEILRSSGLEGCVWVFGSRARGDAGKYSDLDLLVDADGPLTLQLLERLMRDFSDSSLPYRVDVVDAHKLSAAFKAAIQGECQPLCRIPGR